MIVEKSASPHGCSNEEGEDEGDDIDTVRANRMPNLLKYTDMNQPGGDGRVSCNR